MQLIAQQIVNLNWVTGISLAVKFKDSTNIKALAIFHYEKFHRDQFSEVLTEKLISSVSLIGHSILWTCKENSTSFRKNVMNQLIFNF